MLDNALDYADLGLRVVPLDGKRPLLKRWTRRASSNPAVVARWFGSEFPNANLGIATGRGLIALDVDPRNGGDSSFQQLVRRRRLPLTAHALTGGGGAHYVFRCPTSVRVGKRTGFEPGLDLLG